MELWREVWRKGFGVVMDRRHLSALADALREDDDRLTQGSTTTPPPLPSVQDWPAEGTCFAACGLRRLNPGVTVGECERLFAETCFQVDKRLGEPAACRFFLNWFDDTPRDQMRRELLAEVERTLGVSRLEQVVPINDAIRDFRRQVAEGRSDLMPLLADALEEAGETDADLLRWLRT